MKKDFKFYILNAMLFLSLILYFTTLNNSAKPQLYTKEGYVVSVLEGERQLIETSDGNIWEVKNEDIWVTDKVILTFSDNATDDITDDEITKVEKVVDENKIL